MKHIVFLLGFFGALHTHAQMYGLEPVEPAAPGQSSTFEEPKPYPRAQSNTSKPAPTKSPLKRTGARKDHAYNYNAEPVYAPAQVVDTPSELADLPVKVSSSKNAPVKPSKRQSYAVQPTAANPAVSSSSETEDPIATDAKQASDRPSSEMADLPARMLTTEQAKAMYKDFSLQQFPKGARLGFADWVIPGGSNCANTRETSISKRDSRHMTCTPCKPANQSDEPLRLSAYTLKSVSRGQGNVTFRMEGKSGDIELRCASEAGLDISTNEMVERLTLLDIDTQFPMPKEAQLRSLIGGASGGSDGIH